ncbi:hypothetical protein A1O3_08965 [Capronia epimyces CBS 606.96]|uniref:Uncharacterized protein n=1 Tax=Capronia epimyces CBS 606.96 TaxID=1182542 RepID=W9XGX1_9EURO|nr:uncharacterized protein A1O3_08965 [Capronia epimyces CBS 606.96]EXJ79463.1 hypothetical protein A1O3_08965 [Capronia epimyces CBS 606.96]
MSAKYPGRTALTTAELELQFMWQQAELEFSRLTRKNLRADQGKRLEDVLRELEEKYQPQPGSARESSTSNKNKIRDTISKVLNCIQLLGGLVADGASVVFGPATLCFNAISFLIDVPNKIADVYEGIGNLFEEVSHFLALFKIYENFSELDPDLRDGTHKLMMSVVRICGLSIKIIEGGVLHHIKIGAKVAFLKDDSGVRAELVEFKALIDKQSHVTEAVTLQHVLSNEDKLAEALRRQYESAEKIGNIEVGVKTLVADLSDRKLQRITSERVDTMAKMLGMTEEPAQEARRAIQRMKDNRLKGSAQWLMEMQEYKEWKTDTDQLPLLLLCGEPKTGKSYLLAAIDEDLRDQDPTVAIAYYKFSGHDAKSNKEKNRDDVVSALKSMALQLAGQYKTYSKEMAALKDDFKPPDPGKELFEKQWWDKLQLSKYAQMKEEAHIVLLFDGVDELSDSNTTKFFKLVKAVRDEGQAIAKARLRFLVTGKVKTFQNTRQYTTPAGTIPTSDYNEPDIMLYLEQELEGDDVLQGGHVEMMDLLKSIRKTLPTKAQGSFSAVQQKLERVREAVESDAYLDDVETILAEDTAEDVDKLAHKVIGDLNASLNAHDIEQLNELLKWTIFGYTYFSVDELRAALFLSSGRAPLQAFEKKLKNKYMRVLHLEGGTVRVDWDISKLFAGSDRGIPGREAALDIDAAKITMTISINQADTPTVQRFLWDLTERVGIGRFDFTPLKTGNDGKGVIECEEARAHYHLAAHLLKLLCDDPDERTKPLVYYALLYLPLHLDSVREALGEKKLGNLERRTIAKRLVDLLSDVEGMEKFWDTSDDIHESWLSNDAVFTIQSWLDDFKTREVLEPRERRWIRQYASRADGRGGFYRPMTIMVARHWLQDSAWRARQSFSWVDRFIALVSWLRFIAGLL